jgi:hypothetical protein
VSAYDSIASRIDHVNVRVGEPRKLLTVLAGVFELPILWPTTEFSGFASGSVFLGNMGLEPTRFGPVAGDSDEAELFAICLEPALPARELATELGRRGVPHSPTIPYPGRWPLGPEEAQIRLSPGRGDDPLWTWVFLGGLLGDRAHASLYSSRLFRSRLGPAVARLMGRLSAGRRTGRALGGAMAPKHPYAFFCEYTGLDAAAARAEAREDLVSRGGGPLGIRAVREVVVCSPDPGAEAERWHTLLAPAEEMPGNRWPIGDGPAIRIDDGPKSEIRSLLIEVRSPDAAASLVEEKGLLDHANGEVVLLNHHALGGLRIELTGQ